MSEDERVPHEVIHLLGLLVLVTATPLGNLSGLRLVQVLGLALGDIALADKALAKLC